MKKTEPEKEKEQVIEKIIETVENDLVEDMIYQIKIMRETLEIMPLANLKKYQERGI